MGDVHDGVFCVIPDLTQYGTNSYLGGIGLEDEQLTVIRGWRGRAVCTGLPSGHRAVSRVPFQLTLFPGSVTMLCAA